MSTEAKPLDQTGWKRVSIEQARELCKKPGALVWWRPEPHLPEEKQYALVAK